MFKAFFFFSEDNNFKELLNDSTLKPHISTKIVWKKYLIIEFDITFKPEHESYLLIKYGEHIRDPYTLFKNRKPIIFKDYLPINLNPKIVFK